MEVRGSVIISIEEFVKRRHSDKFEDWKGKLPKGTLELMNNPGAQKWYPVQAGVIDPTQLLCDMFYSDTKKGAWESGRYSAETALKGIYKVFVLVSTPGFMIKRASRIMTTFYNPTHIEVADSQDKSMLLELTELPVNNELIEYRIAGWIEKALEICGCKNLSIQITSALSRGDDKTVFDITWD